MMKELGERFKFTLYIDGAARDNPGPAGIGVLVIDYSDNKFEFSEYIGETTNNIAEYTAFIFGLKKVLELRKDAVNKQKVSIYSDSELLVNQMKGLFKIKNQGLKPLFNHAKSLLACFEKVELFHVFREENLRADKLANEAIDAYLKGEKSELKLEGIAEQESLF